MTILHTVPMPRPQPPTRLERVSSAVVRRAVPVLAGSAAALVATIAAERAIREVALGAMQHLGAAPRSRTDFVRTVVTEITIERYLRRA